MIQRESNKNHPPKTDAPIVKLRLALLIAGVLLLPTFSAAENPTERTSAKKPKEEVPMAVKHPAVGHDIGKLAEHAKQFREEVARSPKAHDQFHAEGIRLRNVYDSLCKNTEHVYRHKDLCIQALEDLNSADRLLQEGKRADQK